MTKFVTLTFTRDELADALCRTTFHGNWFEKADEVISILSAIPHKFEQRDGLQWCVTEDVPSDDCTN